MAKNTALDLTRIKVEVGDNKVVTLTPEEVGVPPETTLFALVNRIVLRRASIAIRLPFARSIRVVDTVNNETWLYLKLR